MYLKQSLSVLLVSVILSVIQGSWASNPHGNGNSGSKNSTHSRFGLTNVLDLQRANRNQPRTFDKPPSPPLYDQSYEDWVEQHGWPQGEDYEQF